MTESIRKYEGGDALLNALEKHSVRTLFSVSGGPINSAYHASTRSNVRVIHTRNESAAGFMADAVYRSTGNPAGALVTLGPAVTNTVTPAACAMSAGLPFIIIGGQASTSVLHKGAGMEFDTLSIMQRVTKWAAQVLHVDRIEEFVDEAFRRMYAGTPGPVYLEIPVNVLSAATDPISKTSVGQAPVRSAAPKAEIDRARELIQASRRPLIIGGDGVHHSKAASQFASWVKSIEAPVTTLRLARGAVDEKRNEHWIGPAYVPANRVFSEALESADLIVLLGHHWEFDLEFGQGISDDANVIQVHHDAAMLGRNGRATQQICATADQFIEQIGHIDAPRLEQGWVRSLRTAWQEQRSDYQIADASSWPHPLEIVDAVANACPDGTRFVTSHGNVDFWADPHLLIDTPRTYLRAGQSGALGAEIPYGVGSAVEDDGTPSVVIVGDGAAGYQIAELETAVRENATVIVVVLDDNSWGAIALPQAMDYGVEVEMDLPERDWAKVAQGLGAFGEKVGRKEVGDAVRAAIERGGPTVIQVNVASVLSPYMAHNSK